MAAKRSLTAQLQEIDRIIGESRASKDAHYRRETQLSIRETLVWLQKNERAIKGRIEGRSQ
ncbi:hypothetical protein ABE527_18440 [Brucella sp. TWI432]